MEIHGAHKASHGNIDANRISAGTKEFTQIILENGNNPGDLLLDS